MSQNLQPTSFKFRFVVGGATKGFFRSPKGVVGTDDLRLDDTTIPYGAIGDTITRGNRLILQILPPTLEGEAGQYLADSVLVLEPKGIAADRLEIAIDRRVAAARLDEMRRLAQEEGTEHLIRVESCPTCEAEVDLTGLDRSLYVYCPYCDSIHETGRTTSLGRAYRTCDECQFFGRVQQYPEFYFYFLLIFYGFSYKKRFLCASCAHRLFVKALLVNLIFVIGVPTAVWVKVKSKIGRDPGMMELHVATALARKGKLREAAPVFDSIRRRFPEHPGVLMNEGLACLKHGDTIGGNQRLERALSACPNYDPLLRLLSG